MKKKPCTIIFNTKCGYVCAPIECASITDALRLAKDYGMAYRLFVDGKLYRRGWIR